MRRGLSILALSATLLAAAAVAVAVAPGAQAASWNTAPAAAGAAAPDADTQPPTVPTNLTGRASCNPLTVTLSWTAATDDVGVTGYDIFAGNSPSGPFSQLGTSTTTTFSATLRFLDYEVRARDAAGNVSAFTAPIQVLPPPCPTLPPSSPPPSTPPTDTQPPTVPTNLAFQVSCTPLQVTLTWTASTDNVGVTGYDIFGATSASGPFTQAGTSTTTTSVQTFKFFYYEVRARDAAGNVSAFTAAVFTPPPPCATPPSSCTAVYSLVGNPWQGGFQGQVTVTNNGPTATSSWTVTLTFADGQSIAQLWGARTTSTTSPYTITNETYNGVLAANASTTFGFIGNGNGATAAPTLTCSRRP
jgi:ligand-binding SRPBCC domain-containing protein